MTRLPPPFDEVSHLHISEQGLISALNAQGELISLIGPVLALRLLNFYINYDFSLDPEEDVEESKGAGFDSLGYKGESELDAEDTGAGYLWGQSGGEGRGSFRDTPDGGKSLSNGFI